MLRMNDFLQPEDASWLTAVFWAGFGIGRGSGIITSKYIKPSSIIIADLVGTTAIMVSCTFTTWIVHNSAPGG